MRMSADSPVVGLSLSPAMDMLATVHEGRRGVYLWANSQMYSAAPGPLKSSAASLAAADDEEDEEEAGDVVVGPSEDPLSWAACSNAAALAPSSWSGDRGGLRKPAAGATFVLSCMRRSRHYFPT